MIHLVLFTRVSPSLLRNFLILKHVSMSFLKTEAERRDFPKIVWKGQKNARGAINTSFEMLPTAVCAFQDQIKKEKLGHFLKVSIRSRVMETLYSEIEAYVLGTAKPAWEIYWRWCHVMGDISSLLPTESRPGLVAREGYKPTSFSLPLCLFWPHALFWFKRHWAYILSNTKCLWRIFFLCSHRHSLKGSPVETIFGRETIGKIRIYQVPLNGF